jgi:hypothetical protein
MSNNRCFFCLWGSFNERCRIRELPLDNMPENEICLAFTFLPDTGEDLAG